MRKPSLTVLKEMNDQVSSYIRGQLTVAFAVAIMFMVGFSLIGLDYAITLGIAAGFLNLIPYLGSFSSDGSGGLFGYRRWSCPVGESPGRLCDRTDY